MNRDSLSVTARVAGVVMTTSLFICANPNASAEQFRPSPLCEAIVSENMGLATQMVEQGADVNASYGCALMAAAQRAQLQLVKLLFDRGAKPNLERSGDLTVFMGGSTPLEAAVQSRNVEVVRLLLERGSNPRDDFDAFSVALNFGDVEMAELLLRHGANPNMRSLAAVDVYAFPDKRMVKVAPRDLESDRIGDTVQRLQCTLTGGNSLLHAATEPGQPGGEGRRQIAKLLLERGADPNATTVNGSTPLMNAAQGDYLSVISMLIKSGADLTAKDRCGRTAEDYARYPETKNLLNSN